MRSARNWATYSAGTPCTNGPVACHLPSPGSAGCTTKVTFGGGARPGRVVVDVVGIVVDVVGLVVGVGGAVVTGTVVTAVVGRVETVATVGTVVEVLAPDVVGPGVVGG